MLPEGSVEGLMLYCVELCHLQLSVSSRPPSLDQAHTGYTVVDWTPTQKRFIWGNKATLDKFGMTLEKFQQIDMDNQSKAANDYCQEIFEQTQQQKKTVSRLKTAYPGGKPLTSRDIYKPIETDLELIGESRTLVLMCMLPVDEDNQSKVAAHAEEVLRYAVSMFMKSCTRGKGGKLGGGRKQDVEERACLVVDDLYNFAFSDHLENCQVTCKKQDAATSRCDEGGVRDPAEQCLTR
eukprot:2210241-Rhodomonas_salina.1